MGTPGDDALNLLSTPIRTLIQREPITLSPVTPIQAVAKLMSDLRVSSVFLLEQDHLFKLITDRDLRKRVVAQGLDITRQCLTLPPWPPLQTSKHCWSFHVTPFDATESVRKKRHRTTPPPMTADKTAFQMPGITTRK